MDIIIRTDEGCAPDSTVLWDSVWRPADGVADWRIADADETGNHGGLRAKAVLATAVTLALFTDKRCPPDHPLYYLADGDPRGYWGDGIDVRADLGEGELGSLLWLFRRAALTVQGTPTTRWVEQIAIEALKPLKDQGAVVRMDVAATTDGIQRLDLTVNLYGRDGSHIYDRKFDLIWNQVR